MMTDIDIRNAASILGVDVVTLVDIVNVGDIKPTVSATPRSLPSGEVWKNWREIRLSQNDIERFRVEIRRRRFVDFKAEYADVFQPDTAPGTRGLEFKPGWTGILTIYADGLRSLGKQGLVCRLRWGKEKFGALRLYSDYILAAEPEVIKLHRQAYHSSLQTCQECGEPGRLRSGYSVCLTLCERHKHVVGNIDPERDGKF
ncbi:hypothetical protein [Rhizobium sp. Kim5]|uniref:hypothetical protein n=1 Tax=Rhizobium sp. Kim5 TaxID=2020311 RepID=UPI000A32E7E8|nr:hypothetical protein [Rhizobium sp. Kim5]